MFKGLNSLHMFGFFWCVKLYMYNIILLSFFYSLNRCVKLSLTVTHFTLISTTDNSNTTPELSIIYIPFTATDHTCNNRYQMSVLVVSLPRTDDVGELT